MTGRSTVDDVKFDLQWLQKRVHEVDRKNFDFTHKTGTPCSPFSEHQQVARGERKMHFGHVLDLLVALNITADDFKQEGQIDWSPEMQNEFALFEHFNEHHEFHALVQKYEDAGYKIDDPEHRAKFVEECADRGIDINAANNFPDPADEELPM